MLCDLRIRNDPFFKNLSRKGQSCSVQSRLRFQVTRVKGLEHINLLISWLVLAAGAWESGAGHFPPVNPSVKGFFQPGLSSPGLKFRLMRVQARSEKHMKN